MEQVKQLSICGAAKALVDRSADNDQSSLGEFIRNERRVELAGEGFRYFDIIRWRIVEDVLNTEVKSMDLDNWTGVDRSKKLG